MDSLNRTQRRITDHLVCAVCTSTESPLQMQNLGDSSKMTSVNNGF